MNGSIFTYNAGVPAIYLFTGENAYLLREERRRWIDQYIEKYGEDTLVRLDGNRLTIRELLDEVSVAPFIVPKRLIVVDSVPKASNEEMELLEQHVHPDVILLFCDPKPDKRLGGVKQLIAIAEVKEFKPLQGAALQQWMMETVKKSGTSIESCAISLLLDLVGQDQLSLHQELAKLSLSAKGKPITPSHIEDLVIPSDEGIVWQMTDLLVAGKREEAILYVHRLLSRGGEAYSLWAILLSMLKNVVAVFAQVQDGISDQKEIAANTGIHPFALRSLLPQARKMKREPLRAFLEWAVEADKALKTGSLRATDEAPQELQALLDEFLLRYP